MTFLNPFLLFGSLLAIVPLIIHLWSKRQAKRLDFSSLMFLLEAHKKSVKRFQLKHIFLLILRMLILTLIAVALSRPVLTSGFALVSPLSAKTSCVIVLDNSYSMGYMGLRERRFDIAKRKAYEIVNSLQNGDSASLILMSDHPNLIFRNLTKQLKDVAKALENADLSHRGTDVYSSLSQAYTLLRRSSDPNKEVYLITDLTLNGWKNFQKNLGSDGGGNSGEKVFIIDVGESSFQNTAIESIRFPNKLVGVNMPFKLEAAVANFSKTPLKDAILSLIIDGAKRYEISVNVEANSKMTYDFSHRFEHPGVHVGKVELTHDRLQIDDTRHFAVDIYGQIGVICVGNQTLYLNLALNPQVETSRRDVSTESGSIIIPTIISESEFDQINQIDLENYQVAILADLSKITKKAEAKLESFLAKGQGVITFMGKNASPESYNHLKFIPAQIAEKDEKNEKNEKKNKIQPAPTLFIADYDRHHPALMIFDEQLISGSDAPRFYNSHELRPKEGAKVLASFNNDLPAIVEFDPGSIGSIGISGSGRTVLINASPSDLDWTNLPLKSLFLPLIQQLVMHLTSTSNSNQMPENINLAVGETYKGSIKAGTWRRQVPTPIEAIQLYTPSNPEEPTLIANLNGEFKFDQTENAGIYKVEIIGSNQVKRSFFAVNINPEESKESNLQRISEAEALKKLGRNSRLVSVAANSANSDNSANSSNSSKSQPLRKSMASARSGREIWRELLAVAAILLLLETLISNSRRETKTSITSITSIILILALFLCPLNALGLGLKLKSVLILDVSVIPPNELIGVMKTKIGNEIDPVELEQDMGRIELYYEQKGYTFAKVKNYRIDDSGVVIIRVDEGKIGTIALKGNARTKARIVLQELLFKEGDIFNSELADESERILRKKPYLGQAEITAKYDENSDYVNVQVKVDDLWTLFPAASVPNFSKDNTDIIFQISESNFLGHGQKLRTRYRYKQEDEDIKHFISGIFMEPRLLGTHWELETNYIQSQDGNSWKASLTRPFFSLSTKWSTEIAVQDLRGIAKWYEDKDKDGRITADEEDYKYEQTFRSEFGRITRAIGSRHEQTRLSLWYSHVNNKYKLLEKYFPSSANFENRNQQMLGISIGRAKIDFIQETFLEKMGKVEDLEVGVRQGVSIGRSLKLLGSDRNETFVNISINSLNRYESKHFLKTEADFTTNLSQSRLRGSVARGGLAYLLKRSKNHTIATRLFGLLAFNLEGQQQFIIGGDGGLRGYPAKSFNSDKYIILNLEDRRVFWKHPLIVIGIAAFSDIGYIESRGKPSSWENIKMSLGVGLRTGWPKITDSPVFRIDVAYAFKAKERRFLLFSTGQAF